MFDCVSCGGFSSRCKSRIKVIRYRINVIAKKRDATVRYLKKSMAELLRNRPDQAYERAEGLVSEMNRLYCYQLIDKFCGCILEKLSTMRKQRECPLKSREAVSTLMFAAARFADLPELRDLRHIFGARYGEDMDSSINKEFAQKVKSEPPSMDQKLHLMWKISEEFSIKWDHKAFKERISNSSRSATDGAEKYESLRKGKDGGAARGDKDETTKVRMPSYERHKKSPIRHEAKMGNGKVNHPMTATPGYSPSFSPKKLEYVRSAENLTPNCSNNGIPPYVKANCKHGTNLKIHTEPSKCDNLSIVHRGTAFNKQDRSQLRSNNDLDEKQLIGPVALSNGHGGGNDFNYDHSAGEAELLMTTARRKKQLKLLANDHYGTTEDKEPVRHPGGRSQGTRQAIHPNFDNEHDEEDMIMDELLILYSRKALTYEGGRATKGMKAPVGHISKSELDQNKMEARLICQSEFLPKGHQAYASDVSKLSPQRNKLEAPNSEYSSPLRGLRSLNHASDATKSSLCQRKDEARSNSKINQLPVRVASLPPGSKTSPEMVKLPARATSLEPNMLRPYVHPKLPDYDDLAAQFTALRGERRKKD